MGTPGNRMSNFPRLFQCGAGPRGIGASRGQSGLSMGISSRELRLFPASKVSDRHARILFFVLVYALMWLASANGSGLDTNLPPPRPGSTGEVKFLPKPPDVSAHEAVAATNAPVESASTVTNSVEERRNSVLTEGNMMFASTNLVRSEEDQVKAKLRAQEVSDYKKKLETARSQRAAGLYEEATPNYASVLNSEAPDDLKKASLLELALIAQDQKNLTRALQTLSQYLTRWPHDANVPEVLLRQGLLYRQLGIHNMAMVKFYATMTTALTLTGENFDFYRRLVLQAQAEIAETLALQNKHKEASEAFAKLLKEESPALNRAQVKYRYLNSLVAQDRHAEAIGQAQDFLAQFPTASEQAEVRFVLASSLKKLGRNKEALQEVLKLLRSQQSLAKEHPETLAYWQQRTGNEIANQLYQEGDFIRALDIYQSLLPLNPTPTWQCPLLYQIGLAYERLEQPTKASDSYGAILAMEKDIGTNAPASLKSMLDMARWRQNFLQWQVRTEIAHREFKPFVAPTPPTASDTNSTKL